MSQALSFSPKALEAVKRQVLAIALTAPDLNTRLSACQLVLRVVLESARRNIAPVPNVNILIADAENRARVLLQQGQQPEGSLQGTESLMLENGQGE